MNALQWPTSSYGVSSAERVNMCSFNHFSLSVDPTSVFFGGTTPIYFVTPSTLTIITN